MLINHWISASQLVTVKTNSKVVHFRYNIEGVVPAKGTEVTRCRVRKIVRCRYYIGKPVKRFQLELNTILDTLTASESIIKRAISRSRSRTIKAKTGHFETFSQSAQPRPSTPKRDARTGITFVNVHNYEVAIVASS